MNQEKMKEFVELYDKAQMKFINSIMPEGISFQCICKHQSDGNTCCDKERFPEKNKCIECGGFYR